MSRRGVTLRVPALLLAGLLAVGTAGLGQAAENQSAAEPRAGQFAGPSFRISSGPKREVSKAVAFNATDQEYLVVWEDWRATTTRGTDIYGRRIDADGVPIGPAFRICRYQDTFEDSSPTVAWNDARNEYLVAWVHYTDLYSQDEILGRRIRGDGTFVGPAFHIGGGAQFSAVSNPVIAWNNVDHQYLVVWEYYLDYDDEPIFGQRVAGNGTLLGPELRIGGLACADKEALSPTVAFNATRTEYLVVWQDARSFDTRKYDLYGRRIDADGRFLGSDFLVSGPLAVESEFGPIVAWNGALNQYLLV